jgi:hypothetical protein
MKALGLAREVAKEERKLFPKVAGLVTGRGLRRETRLPPGVEPRRLNRALHPKPLSYPPLGTPTTSSSSSNTETRTTNERISYTAHRFVYNTPLNGNTSETFHE